MSATSCEGGATRSPTQRERKGANTVETGGTACAHGSLFVFLALLGEAKGGVLTRYGVSMSSMHPLFVKGNCMDNDHTNFCHSDGVGSNLWIEFDLSSNNLAVYSVLIYNRASCCKDRLGSYQVWIGNTANTGGSSPNTLCRSQTASSTAATIGGAAASARRRIAGEAVAAAAASAATRAAHPPAALTAS